MQLYQVGANETFSGSKEVSSHFTIDEDGSIQQFVLTNFSAYHAGVGLLQQGSKLNAPTGSKETVMANKMNDYSIGIASITNGKQMFEKELIESNVLLCQHLADKYLTIDVKK